MIIQWTRGNWHKESCRIRTTNTIINFLEENFFIFFGLFFIRFVLANCCIISDTIPCSIQSLAQRRFTVLINIFSRSYVSYFPFLWISHGRICITEYSGFICKRQHLSYQYLVIGDRSVSIDIGSLKFPATE